MSSSSKGGRISNHSCYFRSEIKRVEHRMDMDGEIVEAKIGKFFELLLDESQKIVTSMFNLMQ
jgi:hypothetical protein